MPKLFDSFTLTPLDVVGCINILNCGWFYDTPCYNFPTWFVSILLLCYTLYALYESLLKSNPKYYYIAVAATILLGAFLVNKNYKLPFLCYRNGLGYLNFFIGVILYKMLAAINDRKYSLPLQVVSVLLIVLIYTAKHYSDYSYFNKFRDCIYGFAICPAFLILVLLNSGIRYVLRFPLFKYLGKMSSLAFFLHMPVVYIYGLRPANIKVGNNYDFVVYLIVLYAICSVFYYLLLFLRKKQLHTRLQK